MAAAFRFRLEALLRLRRQRETAQKRMVAAAAARVIDARGRIERLDAQVAWQTEAIRRAMQSERLPIEDVSWGRHWLGRLRRDSLAVQAELAASQERLALERDRLSDAIRRTKVLEKLRERQYAEYVAHVERTEAAALDEVAISRFLRRRSAEVVQ